MAKQEDETKNKLANYTKAKSAIEKKMKHLKKELVEILNSYKTILQDQQQSDMESLNAKMESYRCLHQNLEDYKKPAKDMKIENDIQLFLLLVEIKQQYKTYSEFHETLQKDMDDIGSFTLKDKRLPGLIQELSDISCFKYAADGHQSIVDNDKNVAGEFQRNQYCQIDPTVFDDLKAGKKDQASFNDETEMQELETTERVANNDLDNDVDDTECSSTEDVLEKSFLKIKSCSLSKEANLSEYCNISDSCFLPDGQMVLVESLYGYIKVLDTDLKVTVELRLWKSEQKAKHVAVVDRNTVVVFVSPSKLLQFISIKPALKFEQKIHIKCECDGIACYKKELYIYSRCLDELGCFRCEGFQILSFKGEVLKTIPLFDDIDSFCLSKEGNIVYFGSRSINDIKEPFMKCVTRDGTSISQSVFPRKNLPGAVVLDDVANIIICDRSAGTDYCGHPSYSSTVEVISTDGKKKCIISPESKWRNLTTLCYNKHNDSLLVVGRDSYNNYSMNIARLYKLEY